MKKSLLVWGIILILSGPLILITGTVYTLMLPNIYASSARISVSEEAPSINPFADQQSGNSAYNPYFLRTQFEMIQSKPILYEVINRLNLQVEWGHGGERLPRNVALKILKNSVSIFQQRDTSLIYITVRRDDPMEAARIANEIAETYRDSRLDLASKEARATIDKTQEALEEQKSRVDEAEQRVEQLRKAYGVTGEGSVDASNIRLQQLEDDHLAAQRTMVEKEVWLKIMEELEGKVLLERASIITFDQLVLSTIKQIQDTEVRLVSLEKDYGSDHPEVQRYRLQKENLEKALEQRLVTLENGLETEYLLAKNKLETLDKVLAELRRAIIDVSVEKYPPFRNAQSELESERFTYNQLKARFRQELIFLEVPRNPVQIIDIAEPNRRPVSPNLFMNVLLSLLLGTIPTVAGIILVAVGTARKNPPSIPSHSL